MGKIIDLGKTNYEAFAAHLQGSLKQRLEPWERVSPQVKESWRRAALIVATRARRA